MWSTNPWADWAQIFFGGRRLRHNHRIQILWRSVQGFWVGWRSNLPFPIYFEGRPYNTHTTVWGVMNGWFKIVCFLPFLVVLFVKTPYQKYCAAVDVREYVLSEWYAVALRSQRLRLPITVWTFSYDVAAAASRHE